MSHESHDRPRALSPTAHCENDYKGAAIINIGEEIRDRRRLRRDRRPDAKHREGDFHRSLLAAAVVSRGFQVFLPLSTRLI